MQCLTKEQCSAWLQDRTIIEAPYGRELIEGIHYSQSLCPHNEGGQRYLARILAGEPSRNFMNVFDPFEGLLGKFEGGLLVITDWFGATPDQMSIFTSFRHASGHEGFLIDSPGHLFGENDIDELVAQLWLIMMFGWSAYFYTPSKSTILIWEGDLIDFWTFDRERIEKIKTKIKSLHLNHPNWVIQKTQKAVMTFKHKLQLLKRSIKARK